jgi:hypothetical protein
MVLQLELPRMLHTLPNLHLQTTRKETWIRCGICTKRCLTVTNSIQLPKVLCITLPLCWRSPIMAECCLSK